MRRYLGFVRHRYLRLYDLHEMLDLKRNGGLFQMPGFKDEIAALYDGRLNKVVSMPNIKREKQELGIEMPRRIQISLRIGNC